MAFVAVKLTGFAPTPKPKELKLSQVNVLGDTDNVSKLKDPLSISEASIDAIPNESRATVISSHKAVGALGESVFKLSQTLLLPTTVIVDSQVRAPPSGVVLEYTTVLFAPISLQSKIANLGVVNAP